MYSRPRSPAEIIPADGVIDPDLQVADCVLAVAAAVVVFANLFVSIPLVSTDNAADRSFASSGWPAIGLVLLGTLSLIWRRKAPVTVLAICASAYCLYVVLGYPAVHPFAPAIAVYALAVRRSSLIAATGAAAVSLSAAIAVAIHVGWQNEDLDDLIFFQVLLIGAACMLGYGIQLDHARKSMLLEQAARLAREHAEETQIAIRDEQARIARELHDVVAHHVSVITAQAGGAQQIFDSEPELARLALQSIETTGRGALTEMRLLLGVLDAAADAPDYRPPPMLDQLPSLVARMQRAGLPVELDVRGAPRAMPPAFELNAFRIVQEALTNTLEHAGQATAQVQVTYHSGGLDVSVRDDGCGFAEGAMPGHGLIGMRQRTALLGGELLIRSGSAEGVEVTVSLPCGVPVQ